MSLEQGLVDGNGLSDDAKDSKVGEENANTEWSQEAFLKTVRQQIKTAEKSVNCQYWVLQVLQGLLYLGSLGLAVGSSMTFGGEDTVNGAKHLPKIFIRNGMFVVIISMGANGFLNFYFVSNIVDDVLKNAIPSVLGSVGSLKKWCAKKASGYTKALDVSYFIWSATRFMLSVLSGAGSTAPFISIANDTHHEKAEADFILFSTVVALGAMNFYGFNAFLKLLEDAAVAVYKSGLGSLRSVFSCCGERSNPKAIWGEGRRDFMRRVHDGEIDWRKDLQDDESITAVYKDVFARGQAIVDSPWRKLQQAGWLVGFASLGVGATTIVTMLYPGTRDVFGDFDWVPDGSASWVACFAGTLPLFTIVLTSAIPKANYFSGIINSVKRIASFSKPDLPGKIGFLDSRKIQAVLAAGEAVLVYFVASSASTVIGAWLLARSAMQEGHYGELIEDLGDVAVSWPLQASVVLITMVFNSFAIRPALSKLVNRGLASVCSLFTCCLWGRERLKRNDAEAKLVKVLDKPEELNDENFQKFYDNFRSSRSGERAPLSRSSHTLYSSLTEEGATDSIEQDKDLEHGAGTGISLFLDLPTDSLVESLDNRDKEKGSCWSRFTRRFCGGS